MDYLQGGTAEMSHILTVSDRQEIDLLLLFRRMPPEAIEGFLYIASVIVDPHGVTRKKREKV